jgi:hypothetical protein
MMLDLVSWGFGGMPRPGIFQAELIMSHQINRICGLLSSPKARKPHKGWQ